MISKLAASYSLAQISNEHSKCSLIQTSKEFFDMYLEELRAAKESIYIANYLFEKGTMVDELVEILIQKSNEGLTVVLVLDTIGSFSAFKIDQESSLVEAGVEIHYFHRMYRFWDINERSHIRLFSIDSSIAYLGGVGFNDEWRDGSISDHMFRFTNDEAVHIESLFFQLEDYCLHGKSEDIKEPRSSKGDILTTTLQSGRIIQDLFMDIISQTKESLIIVSPYCIPPKKIIRAIEKASKRGVSISIYTNSLKNSDHWYINKASCVVYARLLKRGVKVYTYDSRYMHNKLMLIDDVVFGGTVNFDYRSLLINHEVYFLTKQKHVHDSSLELISKIRNESTEMKLSKLKKLPWYQWALNYFFYFFRRIM